MKTQLFRRSSLVPATRNHICLARTAPRNRNWSALPLLCLPALLLAGRAQAGPDPVTVSNNVATAQGNQANGIASGSDFQSPPVSVLNVNSLSGAIQPAAGKAGISFVNGTGGNVIISSGMPGSNVVIQTLGSGAGISARSTGQATTLPPPDPLLGIRIPTASTVPGGLVSVDSHSDITTVGDGAYGIVGASQTAGYPPSVLTELEGFTNSGLNVSFTVTSVDGASTNIGQAVQGLLVDTNGQATGGSGGTFILQADGSFTFDMGNDFTNMAVGTTQQVIATFDLAGSSVHGTNLTTGAAIVEVVRTDTGFTVEQGAYSDTYGPCLGTNSVVPDLTNYVTSLIGTAQAGGAGNSVSITNHGSISTGGSGAHGIFAQSLGGNGGTGRGGSISHSAGAGGSGQLGGNVEVEADGLITTTGAQACAVLAVSRGGNGGNGGNGGFWRYGARGGNGTNAGTVQVTGNGTLHTYGDQASGILAVSQGGYGGSGGNGKAFTGGGNGGYGGMGGDVVVAGNWNITTEGDAANGIWAKSAGGNAGSGGSGGWISGAPGGGGAATDGGTVSVDSGGSITTLGQNSSGIYAESIGGFGGSGGSQTGIFYSHGGDGNSAGSGGEVNVTQEAGGQITTYGTNSHGIFAQSVGGGGGSGGGGGAIAGFGGPAGAGGRGGTVNVTNYGLIQTFGVNAHGIYAQSVGGGGGDGGSGAGLAGLGANGGSTSPGGLVSVANFGSITTTGSLSDAIFAQSVGGGGGSGGSGSGVAAIGGSASSGGSGSNVFVINSGQLETLGVDARGIVAQSVGGGGGDGGNSGGLVSIGGAGSATSPGGEVNVVNSGTVNSRAQAIFAQSVGGGGGNGGSSGGWFSFGGSGGGGGNGGVVTVNNSGNLTNSENNAAAIFAQSVGGGGGNGGNSVAVGAFVSVAVGGSGGKGGNGNDVTVNSGTNSIETYGNNSHGIQAQSVGGGGGNGGFAFSGSVGTGFSAALGIGGKGGDGGAASNVVVNSASAITTHGTNAHAIFAQSVGGGGGSGGFSIAVTGSEGPSLSLSIGGKGGGGGNGETVTVTNSGELQTWDDRSYGILAQSVGGGGGDGGFSVSAAGSLGGLAAPLSFGGPGATGGIGGLVFVSNSGQITTHSNDAHGIMAQSVGGGGGSGGFSVAGSVSSGGALSLSFGGAGGAGSASSNVTVKSAGDLTTYGDRSYGILAQSVGGGGGSGGFSVAGSISTGPSASLSLGGSGGAGAAGGAVEVDNAGNISTFGTNAHAIFAQSVGGGGGSGGFSVAGSISGDSGAVSASIGGKGAGGGDAGAVTVTNAGAMITTAGEHSYGLLAQSIGGSGGDGGFSVAGSISKGPSASLSIGGGGGRAGAGGAVTVANFGSISTTGSLSDAIFAQSVGGGGGSGGFSVAGSVSADSGAIGASIGGSGAGGGDADVVTVMSRGPMISTKGDEAFGILAQSIGGGGGNGGFSVAGSVSKGPSGSLSIGGSGGAGGNGGAVNVENASSITTSGTNAAAIFAQSVGGGGGNGGFSVAGGVSVDSFSASASIGGSGKGGGNAGTVTITNEAALIHTLGANSEGILAQSVGGGGGNGGFSVAGGFSKKATVNFSVGGQGGVGGDGGLVSVANAGAILTEGDASHGIFAQSVGGGGGKGGFSAAGSISTGEESKQLSVTIGGDGGGGGAATNVVVVNEGNIETHGEWSHGIFAQSVGGGGGDGGNAQALNKSLEDLSPSNMVASASSESGGNKSWSLSLAIGAGGNGGSAGDGGKVTVSNFGSILTTNSNSRGIFAQSVGGGGGTGGTSATDSGGSGNTNLSINLGLSLGGKGGVGGAADLVTVTNAGNITTLGQASHGIMAQSVGGGGGAGGASTATAGTPGTNTAKSITLMASLGGDGGVAGNGSNVFVVNTGRILTAGEGAYGILAQSIGGGGGDGGTATAEIKSDEENSSNEVANALPVASSTQTNEAESSSWNVGITIGSGGQGGSAGDGGKVTVYNAGDILTEGANAHGIFAQSVGGGGGAGGSSTTDNGAASGDTSISLSLGLGGKGGAGGNGDSVTVVNTGAITNFGDGSHGIMAQSIGGGGGAGGASVVGGATTSDSARSVNVNASLGGSGGVAGDGGTVDVANDGHIDTYGNGSYGILAQSVGGGGGHGGTAKIETGQEESDSTSPSLDSDTNTPSWSVNLGIGAGGAGAGGGAGGKVVVNNDGKITTRGTNSLGVFAQSVGGGGGAGGTSSVDNGGGNANIAIQLGLGLGGSGGTGGSADSVSVTNTGSITTLGDSSHAIFAQSVGGGGGMGGDSITTSTPAGTNTLRSFNLSLSLGGSGKLGGNGGAVNVVNDGHIETAGTGADGVLAQSIGGGGGSGGMSVSTPSGGTGNLLQLTVGLGGQGGAGGHADAVNLTSSGGIITYGDDSYAILAQSIGGGGGVGGNSVTAAGSNSTLDLSIGIGGAGGNGNYGGTVTVTNIGDLATYGNNALGILAQSIGGGGGRGGNAMAQTNLSGGGNNLTLNVSVGGNGAGASDGGEVTVDNVGNIVTAGMESHGIMAQSIGGGGGEGGYGGQDASATGISGADLQIVVGGKGGSGGDGKAVTVQNSGTILTTGDGSFGVLAQSVGGGGGIGGYGQPGALAQLSLGGGGGAGGNGGDVAVNVTGTIETYGNGAYGVFAQSVGGGGGIAGNVNYGVSNAGLALNLGQSGGAGGDGGDVTVVSDGNIITHGTGACGIFAQSVGGGGGLAGDLGNGLSFAGSVGGAGSGGTVHIIHTGNITTYGDFADGIFAQSAGGTDLGAPVEIDYIGSINVYGSNSSAIYVQSRGNEAPDNMTLTVRNGTLQGGAGSSAGVWFADGGNNTLYNFCSVTTMKGLAGNAIIGGTGNETINNDGTIIGSVDLGSGRNAFYNYTGGRVESGATLNLGAGSQFFNAGTLAPGGESAIQRTALTGNLVQTSNGVLQVKLGSGAVSDQLAISGAASLGGTLSVSRFNGFLPTKGDQFAFLTAAQGLNGQFASLDDPLKGNYALMLKPAYHQNSITLQTLQDSFLQFAQTPNQRAVALNLDSVSGLGTMSGDPREADLITYLNTIPGVSLGGPFDLIAPEELGSLFDMSSGIADVTALNVQQRAHELRSGRAGFGRFAVSGPSGQLDPTWAQHGGGGDPLPSEPSPYDWHPFALGSGQIIDIESTPNASGYDIYTTDATLGADRLANDNFGYGLTASYMGDKAYLVNGGRVTVDGAHGGLFATWFGGNAYLNGAVGGGYNYFDTRRVSVGGNAVGSTEGYELDALLGSGYDFRSDQLTFGPVASVQYNYVNIDGFTETGSLAPLHIENNDNNSLRSMVGGRVAYNWMVHETLIRPELQLGWEHEFLDADHTITSRFASGAGNIFSVHSPTVGRDDLGVSAGLTVQWSRHLSTYFAYYGELARQNASAATFNGGLTLSF